MVAPLRTTPDLALPTALEILIPELMNVKDDRLSRLLSPSDRIVAAARSVPDSAQDLIRVTVQAFAAATVARLLEDGKITNNKAYKRVANALRESGFAPPGKKKTRHSTEAVRTWYKKALHATDLFQRRYETALAVIPADPDAAVDMLKTYVRLFKFRRIDPVS